MVLVVKNLPANAGDTREASLIHGLQRLLGESFLPLPAAGSPGVPWLMAASLQSLLPASHYLPPGRQTTLSFLS